METLKESYTAASSLPLKILLDIELIKSITKNRKILPRHIQLNPTNDCTQNCSWCSCSDRDKTQEMNYETVIDTMGKFKDMGARGVTITGGGEFLCHPRANDIIKGLYRMGYDIGLVTNGDLIKRLEDDNLRKINWMRISLGDGKKGDNKYWKNLENAISRGKNVDYSFSYVIANKNPSYNLIRKMTIFANDYNFTHIRFVNDIFNADKLKEVMPKVKEDLKEHNINDKIAIYQDRGNWTKGTKKCLISLLKPVVTADGKLSPCCGDQYKDNPPARNCVGDFGTIGEIDKIWRDQRYYDGSKCVKCYYENYNTLLSNLLSNIKHKNFV